MFKLVGHLMGVVFCFFVLSCAHAAKNTKPEATLDVDSLNRFVNEVVSNSSLPGFSYLVSKDGKIISKGGFGLANVERGVKNTDETVYRAASITKQFTAVSILKLANEGKLSIDDKLSKYFPKLPNSSKITIRNLLTHTSGLWQEHEEDFPYPIDQYVEPAEHLSFLAKKGVLFEPGKEWRYNNHVYFILGLIVEKVSGLTLKSFMKKRIFSPLNMNNSWLCATQAENPSVAVGYGVKNGMPYKEVDVNMKTYNGAATLCSTVNDLFIWNEALFNGKVLPQKLFKQFIEPYKFEKGYVPFVKYGFGIGTEDVGGHLTIGHPGQLKGYQSDILRLPDEKINVIFLSNVNIYQFPVKWRFTDKLIRALYGDEKESGTK